MPGLPAIDALCLAVFQYEGGRAHDRNVRTCNPGNLEDSEVPHRKDAAGYCIFDTMADGWAALHMDLQGKCSGHNRHGLGEGSTLLELFQVFAPSKDKNDPSAYAHFVASWLSRALGVQVTLYTSLSIFIPPPAVPAQGETA